MYKFVNHLLIKGRNYSRFCPVSDSNLMATVWLIKSTEASDSRYSDQLKKCGYNAIHVPALSFKFTNQAPLRQALELPQNYSGIILTSRRAVEAVDEIYRKIPFECHRQWEAKKVFVVGEATASAVKEKLNVTPIGSESSSSSQLAQIITKEIPAFDKPLLFPCSNLKREELPKMLAQVDRDFRAITCYETDQSPELKPFLQKIIISGQKPVFIVFFSPSGVCYGVSMLHSLNFDFTGIKVIAIGPTTNQALVDQKISVFGICSSPTPESLCHVINAPN